MAGHVVTVGTAATGRPAPAVAPQAIGGRTGPSAPLGPQAALLPRSNSRSSSRCVVQLQAQARTSPIAPCPRARFSPSQSSAALQCANSASHCARPCMPGSEDSARRHPIASVAPCSARDPDSVKSAQRHVAKNHRTSVSNKLSLRLVSPATATATAAATASLSFARLRTTSSRASASFAGSRMASSPLIARGRVAAVRPSSSSSDAAPGATTVDLSSSAAARRFTPTCRAQSSSSQLSASPVAPSPLLRPAGFLSSSAGEEEDRVVGGCCSLAAVATGTAAEVAEGEVEQYEASPEFKAKALINSKEEYERMYKQSVEDPDTFWSNIARNFVWETEWEDDAKVHSENLDVRSGRINVEWFKGARTNLCYNALDRWVAEGKGNQTAVIWEGNEPGHTLTLTYADMLQRVCELAATLRRLGIRKGDFVTIYMPMVVELPIAMLACARIGAVHSVVFGGFSAESLAQRIQDCESPLLITASGVMRATKKIPLKAICDDALSLCPDLQVKCLVLSNETAVSRDSTPWTEGRDLWWHEEVAAATSSWSDLEGPAAAAEAAKVAPVEWVDGEDPLFLLYTSGSTGKPKGVLHTTGGYMVYTATTFKYAFDYRPGDVYWCTADCGWITGHSYVTYGPFLNGATQVLFEGVPSYPDWGRCWQIVDDHNVSIFYTAPTAIRAAMSAGDHLVKKHSRKSLRVLGSVGEPINPAAWSWYFNVVGDGRCPISDTWWQTETGGFMITPLPGAWPQRPGSATFPFFGVQPAIVDEKGEELHGEASGYLCMKASWPSMFRTLYADHERYETNYFAPFKGYYFSGDGCRRDADGYYWLTGRVDDVINVSGHRIGTAEVESALVGHPLCAEAAVVGYEHDIKGQGIYAYVTLMDGTEPSEEIRRALIQTVRATIGAFAAPDKIHWAPGLPKTRSGKIMRRILRKIATREEEQLGDISTLADPQVVHQLIQLRGK